MSEPETVRPFVLCADDFAFSEGVSTGISRLASLGRISATSAMVLSPRWREDAKLLTPLRARVDVGLHLDVTSHFAMDAGFGHHLGPLMASSALGTIRGDSSKWDRLVEFQLDAFEDVWHAPPDHIDGHQHIHQFSGIREALIVNIRRRYPKGRRPYLRVSEAPSALSSFKSFVAAKWGARALREEAAMGCIPCAPALAGFYDFSGGVKDYASRMRRWLSLVPSGTLLMCHPSVDHSLNDAISTARVTEFKFLSGDAFADMLVECGVRLVRGSDIYLYEPSDTPA